MHSKKNSEVEKKLIDSGSDKMGRKVDGENFPGSTKPLADGPVAHTTKPRQAPKRPVLLSDRKIKLFIFPSQCWFSPQDVIRLKICTPLRHSRSCKSATV